MKIEEVLDLKKSKVKKKKRKKLKKKKINFAREIKAYCHGDSNISNTGV